MKRAFSRKNLWEALPAPVKGTLGAVLRCVPPTWLLGRTFARTQALIEQSCGWSADAVRAHQLAQLRRVCESAYAHAPYYRRVFDACGFRPDALQAPTDLRQLPLIDKQALRAHLREMCVRDPEGRDVDLVSTGGSSGEPLRFYIQADRSGVEYAHLVAGWAEVGYSLRAPVAVFRGGVVQPRGSGMRHSYDPILRRHAYSNFHMSDAEMTGYLRHVAGLGPCFLLVYPSSAFQLARFIERGGHPRLTNVRAVLAGSESTYPGQRERIEQAFSARYYTWYGHSEKLVLASECAGTRDYHVWPTYGYAELVDEAGAPVTTPGQRGEIVGTGFISNVMPFIRYRTGDWAEYVGDHCQSCGRACMLIRDVQGHRTQEVLYIAGGTAVSWVALNMHDDTFDNVRQFQFRQEQAGRCTLKIVPDADFSDADQARILRNLDRKFDGRMQITIESVAEIPLTRLGKTVYVDQQMRHDQQPSEAVTT